MSHENPSHDRSNEYPSDHYKPHAKKKSTGKIRKSGGPLHNVANRLTAKAEALKKYMNDTGFSKK